LKNGKKEKLSTTEKSKGTSSVNAPFLFVCCLAIAIDFDYLNH